jgi:hypothetical protein
MKTNVDDIEELEIATRCHKGEKRFLMGYKGKMDFAMAHKKLSKKNIFCSTQQRLMHGSVTLKQE